MKKRVKQLALVTVLVIVAMAFLPAVSVADKVCDYEYYYDAAHTQWAGYCAACYIGGNCTGQVTEYYALVNCAPYCFASVISTPAPNVILIPMTREISTPAPGVCFL
jgi:hypothetical protein